MPNLTIKIDNEGLIRQAKVLAARRGVSVSALVRTFLTDLVQQEDEYERARKRAVRNMRCGLSMDGEPLSRDEVYDGRVG